MTTTVQVEQGRWRYLDVQLTSSGTPVGSVTDADATVKYKKYGDLTFSTKTLSSASTTLSIAAAQTDTTITVADSSIFPPDGGQLIIDPAGSAETVTFTNNNVSSDYITLSAGVAEVGGFASSTVVQLVDWVEVTGPPTGHYLALFNPTELNTLDTFVYNISRASGPAFDDFNRTIDIIPATSASTETTPTLATCIVKDHVLTLAGSALQNISVGARLLALPETISGVGVADQMVTALTDANGFFQLTLVQGATVDVVIPETGYRRSFVVPSTTVANLFEIS